MAWLTGLHRLPKWQHLKELHRSIKLCEHVLLNSEPTLLSLGPLQEVLASFWPLSFTARILICLSKLQAYKGKQFFTGIMRLIIVK